MKFSKAFYVTVAFTAAVSSAHAQEHMLDRALPTLGIPFHEKDEQQQVDHFYLMAASSIWVAKCSPFFEDTSVIDRILQTTLKSQEASVGMIDQDAALGTFQGYLDDVQYNLDEGNCDTEFKWWTSSQVLQSN